MCVANGANACHQARLVTKTLKTSWQSHVRSLEDSYDSIMSQRV
jgi:hypothetical protein